MTAIYQKIVSDNPTSPRRIAESGHASMTILSQTSPYLSKFTPQLALRDDKNHHTIYITYTLFSRLLGTPQAQPAAAAPPDSLQVISRPAFHLHYLPVVSLGAFEFSFPYFLKSPPHPHCCLEPQQQTDIKAPKTDSKQSPIPSSSC